MWEGGKLYACSIKCLCLHNVTVQRFTSLIPGLIGNKLLEPVVSPIIYAKLLAKLLYSI